MRSPDPLCLSLGDRLMMGARTVVQEALFYSFSLEDHVPQSHLLRAVDRFVDLDGIREAAAIL
jgi:hypothetical protein